MCRVHSFAEMINKEVEDVSHADVKTYDDENDDNYSSSSEDFTTTAFLLSRFWCCGQSLVPVQPIIG